MRAEDLGDRKTVEKQPQDSRTIEYTDKHQAWLVQSRRRAAYMGVSENRGCLMGVLTIRESYQRGSYFRVPCFRKLPHLAARQVALLSGCLSPAWP